MYDLIFLAEPTVSTNEVYLPKKSFNELNDNNHKVKLWRKNTNTQPLLLTPVIWDKDFVGLNPLLIAGISADFDADNLFDLEIVKKS